MSKRNEGWLEDVLNEATERYNELPPWMKNLHEVPVQQDHPHADTHLRESTSEDAGPQPTRDR